MNINELNILIKYAEEIDMLNHERLSYYENFFCRKECKEILKNIKPYLNKNFYNIFFEYFIHLHKELIPLFIDKFTPITFINFIDFSNIKYTLNFLKYLPDIILVCNSKIQTEKCSNIEKSLFYQKIGELKQDYITLLDACPSLNNKKEILNVVKTIDML